MGRAGVRWFLLAAAVLAGGCAESPQPVVGQVVWFDGRPATELAGGAVTFDATDRPLGCQAGIRPDATFIMTTLKEDDGAFAGRYRVAVREAAPQGDGPPPPPIISDKYHDPATSGLEVTVSPGPNRLTITLERLPSAAGRPRR